MNDPIAEYEGTVPPSFLQTMNAGRPMQQMRGLPLRQGRVIKVHKPKDDSNRSKRFFEYDVSIDDGSEHSPNTRYTIHNCWMLSRFGGAADFSRSTPRPIDASRKHDASDEGFGYGNRVLVLCINGSAFGGVILGGVQHTLGEVDDDSRGHHHIDQFNGVRHEVDNDGQLHITFRGATKVDGSLEDRAVKDATHDDVTKRTGWHLLKDGSIRFNTVADEQLIALDHASHIIKVVANKDYNILSQGTFTWESKGSAFLTVGDAYGVTVQNDIGIESRAGNLNVGILGSIDITSQTQGITLTANAGLIKTSSLGVHLGLATDAMVKGTTYRAAEATMNATVAAGWAAAFAYFGAALTAWMAVGPFMALLDPTGTTTSLCIAAGGAAGAAVAASGAAQAAITSFEGAAPAYLSIKNLLD